MWRPASKVCPTAYDPTMSGRSPLTPSAGILIVFSLLLATVGAVHAAGLEDARAAWRDGEIR